MVALPQPIIVVAAIVEGSHLSGDLVKGHLRKLSSKQAEAELEVPVPALANLKIDVFDRGGREIQGRSLERCLDLETGRTPRL